MNTKPNSPDSFGNLGIAPKLLEILARNKFTTPTPIQLQSIPIAIQGKDLMGIAQTGTGKTLAFGIPMIQSLAQNKGKKGLVLLPTRELALQVDENLKKIGGSLGLKTALVIGGESMHRQTKALRANPHVIVATPGRLNDHIENNKLSLSNVSVLVLDEADHMLDMGFAPQIKKILSKVPAQRQTMLFSATMPQEIITLANSYMSLPLRIEVTPPGTAVKLVTQELFFIDKQKKNELLRSVLEEFKGSVLVFTKTKYKARDVARHLRSLGLSSAEIHSNRSQGQRREALDGFKIGKYRVLVATDIAARGIDVKGIELVVNYDLPATADDYIHRIGRTGRAGLQGRAISFATPDQRREVAGIERLIKQNLLKPAHPLIKPGTALNNIEPEPLHPSASRRPSSGGSKRFGKFSRSKQDGPNRRDSNRRGSGKFPPRSRSSRHQAASGQGYFMTRRP